MSKDYRRKNSAHHRGSVSKQLLLVLVCFLLGYLSASIFDFTSLSSWVNTQVLAQHTIPTAIKATEEAQLPKPKFEFYTLLSSEHTNTNPLVPSGAAVIAALPTQKTALVSVPTAKNQSSAPAVAALTAGSVKSMPAATALINKEAYLVQIASFKRKQEAERMKAMLAIKGFNVNVAIVTQQQIQWYRVILGPFSSRTQAEQARASISASEHIMGMVRKMDA